MHSSIHVLGCCCCCCSCWSRRYSCSWWGSQHVALRLAGSPFASVMLGAFPLCSNHSHDGVERPLNIDASLGGRFDKLAVKLFRHLDAFFARNFPFCHLIALVAYQDERHIRHILDPKYLISEPLHAFKRRSGRYRVHDQEPFTVSDPLIPQRRVFLCRCIVPFI